MENCIICDARALGSGVRTHAKTLKGWARQKEWAVVKVFKEMGESAKSTERTALTEMLTWIVANEGKVDAVLVSDIDRFTRVREDWSILRKRLAESSVVIRSVATPVDETPMGTLVGNFRADIAQFDNSVRAEKTTQGMKDSAQKGRFQWVAPFGYRNAKDKSAAQSLIPDERAPYVKRAFELVATGLYSARQAYETVTTEGLRGKTRKPISEATFYTLLRNETYAAIISPAGLHAVNHQRKRNCSSCSFPNASDC